MITRENIIHFYTKYKENLKTEDQIQAIEDTKRDMESTKIMDRLICGDVGFGKTEIAIRAAFKAVQENKQVVYLVPTTILAQQHYHPQILPVSDALQLLLPLLHFQSLSLLVLLWNFPPQSAAASFSQYLLLAV